MDFFNKSKQPKQPNQPKNKLFNMDNAINFFTSINNLCSAIFNADNSMLYNLQQNIDIDAMLEKNNKCRHLIGADIFIGKSSTIPIKTFCKHKINTFNKLL